MRKQLMPDVPAETRYAQTGTSHAMKPKLSRTGYFTSRSSSSFEIVELLGAGGLGVVYRGVDLRLGRDVALKFLSCVDPDDYVARERFIREARAASSLDHPNIGVVHDID